MEGMPSWYVNREASSEITQDTSAVAHYDPTSWDDNDNAQQQQGQQPARQSSDPTTTMQNYSPLQMVPVPPMEYKQHQGPLPVESVPAEVKAGPFEQQLGLANRAQASTATSSKSFHTANEVGDTCAAGQMLVSVEVLSNTKRTLRLNRTSTKRMTRAEAMRQGKLQRNQCRKL